MITFSPRGGEQFLPLFIKNMENIFFFLKDTKVALTNQFDYLLDQRIENINDFYNARKHLNENFFLDPSKLYLSKDQIYSLIKKFDFIKIT